MIPSSVVEDIARYVAHGQTSATIAEVEALRLHSEAYDLRFLCTQLLNWVVASPLLRSALLKMTAQVWYPVLAQIVSRSATLSTIWTATDKDFHFAHQVTELEAELLGEAVRAIYQPHVSSTIK